MTEPMIFRLGEQDIPQAWYNIIADLPAPPPPVLHPGTGQPVGPDDLAPLFPMALIGQEVSGDRWIEIPEPIREVYRLYRPTPLHRARRLERALDTPAHIYYKYEGVSPAGSHKLNTAIAQAYFNKAEGIKRLTTETGAGQWGSALAMACQFVGLDCTVYMVKVSYRQKPYRRSMMQVFGAEVIPSPSDRTAGGRQVLTQTPDSPGSLGIAISEAVEDAATHDDAHYSLGSVLNHVLLHQTVIGLEAKRQLEMAGEAPDEVIGCVGGGSNFSGLAFPFVQDKLTAGKQVPGQSGTTPGTIRAALASQPRILAVEPAACPTLTRGSYTYDFGDAVGLTPLVKMYTLGHTFVPPSIHAGGLRYHGDAPLLCHLVEHGVVEAVAYPQNPVFAAAIQFAQSEGIIPAPESAHAVKAAIDSALQAKAEGRSRAILFGLSGHGHFDMGAFDAYLGGDLEDYEYPAEQVQAALSELPQVAG